MTGGGALDAAGVQSARIAELFRWFLGISLVVWVLVVGALLVAVLRRRERGEDQTPDPSTAADRRPHLVVGLAIGASALTLFAMLVGSVLTGKAIGSMAPEQALTVRVTGHQWWWEVTYPNLDPSLQVTTANEIHVPVGRPVRFELAARDVIHSFWVPELHGKIDAIPGKKTTMFLQADRAGRFEGRCAEFCGLQHAKMKVLVVAEPPADFERWLDAQRAPGRAPTSDVERRGADLFVKTRCSSCHAVLGTEARASTGPDLTHVGSRWSIGAGALPLSRQHLAAWITDPAASKPGNDMPATPMPGEDLDALVTYLESLR
jgi:cytochrome c oxidase subunit 2